MHGIEIKFDDEAELDNLARKLIYDSSYFLLALESLKKKLMKIKSLEETPEMKTTVKDIKNYLNDITIQKRNLPSYITKNSDYEELKE